MTTPAMSSIKLFENMQVRSHWDEQRQAWFFSIVDVVAVLTGSVDASAYWRKLKQRLKTEGNETVTNCHGLKTSRVIAQQGGTIAGDTRKAIETKSDKAIVTGKNAKRLK